MGKKTRPRYSQGRSLNRRLRGRAASSQWLGTSTTTRQTRDSETLAAVDLHPSHQNPPILFQRRQANFKFVPEWPVLTLAPLPPPTQPPRGTCPLHSCPGPVVHRPFSKLDDVYHARRCFCRSLQSCNRVPRAVLLCCCCYYCCYCCLLLLSLLLCVQRRPNKNHPGERTTTANAIKHP